MIEAVLNIIDIFDKITIIFSFATMFFVAYKWHQDKKQNQKIKISFLVGNKEICLENFSIIRRHITRSEILGILGVIQKNSKERYSIEYLGERQFFDDLYAAQKGNLNKIIIKLSKEELGQFYIKDAT